MTNAKNTKRALFSSVLALLLCFTMLIGTTFAWFTDSVVSNNNTIMSGNLDIELEYLNGDKWDKVTESTNVFKADTLWEPGHTEVVYLRVSNLGTLDLKYKLGINIVNEIESINVNGEALRLSDYIEFGAIDDVSTPYADRKAARDAVTDAKILSVGHTKSGNIEAGAAAQYVALVVYMPEETGNEANHAPDAIAPKIELGINLMATQDTVESDAFDNKYDDGALYDGIPSARVTALAVMPEVTTINGNKETLDVGYVFNTTETDDEAELNSHYYWHADFVAYFDKDVDDAAIGLAGQYNAYSENWLAFELDGMGEIAANTPIRMLQYAGISMNYGELCYLVKEFSCGAFAVNPAAMAGTTMTVELRIYETEEPSAENGNSHNVETGEYEVIGIYSYTFDYPAEEITTVTNDAELARALTDGKTNIELADGTYHMPAVAQGKVFTLSSASGNAEKVIIEVVPGGQSEANGQLDYNLDGSNVCFNKVTIKTNSQLYAGYARLEATYNECIIQNTFNLGSGKSVFNNCTINITNEYLRVYGASKAVFDGCTFNTDGRAILVFQDGSKVDQEVIVKDCTFNATAAAYTWDGIHVAAVSYDGSQGGTYTVTFEGNNVVDSDFNGLWQIKKSPENVTVNGLN